MAQSGDGFSDILIRIEDEDVGIVIEVKCYYTERNRPSQTLCLRRFFFYILALL